MIPTLEEIIAKMEKELGLSPGFLFQLKNEDDWSFIIKCHAFIEAIFSHYIVQAVGFDSLKEIFQNLEMSNFKTGKVAFAEALHIVDSQGKTFIRKLSELRNDVVHNVSQTNCNLIENIKGMDNNQFKSFFTAFSYFASEDDLKFHLHSVESIVKNDPKLAIWLSMVHMTGISYWKTEHAKLNKLNIALHDQVKDYKSI